MKTYSFPWQCEAVSGEVEVSISKKEIKLIKDAYRDAFECLEDCSELDGLRERVLQLLDFYEPDADQDIRIYFPEELTEEVDEEDE